MIRLLSKVALTMINSKVLRKLLKV